MHKRAKQYYVLSDISKTPHRHLIPFVISWQTRSQVGVRHVPAAYADQFHNFVFRAEQIIYICITTFA